MHTFQFLQGKQVLRFDLLYKRLLLDNFLWSVLRRLTGLLLLCRKQWSRLIHQVLVFTVENLPRRGLPVQQKGKNILKHKYATERCHPIYGLVD